MIDNVRCIVLNATYEPLSIVSARRGLVLCLKGKASVVEEHPDVQIVTGSSTFGLPVRIVLKEFRKARATTRQPAQLTQRNLFVRDKYTCQYCGRHRTELKHREFLTRDHIIPQDKGGKDTWLNLVTCCNTCNNKKANYSLEEVGMKLPKQPTIPTVFEIWARTANKLRH